MASPGRFDARADIPAPTIGDLVLYTDCATVFGLAVEEIHQDPSSPVGIINVTGQSENTNGGRVGVCVMLVGKDSGGDILWACCLMVQHNGNGIEQLLESLLVSSTVIGNTTNVVIRMYTVRVNPEKREGVVT